MTTVRERIDTFPFDAPPFVVERREELLLADPLPGPGKRFREHPPIEAVHYKPEYVAQPFNPPRGVYESEFLRVEWQTMNARQPFYHRNGGVDELSYQVHGERTLMTELGSVELLPGDFSRIPVGVAHDNYGRQEIHLLFYVPGPVSEKLVAYRESEAKMPPFAGWQAATLNELLTEGVGGPGQDLMIAPTDEQLLLDKAMNDPARITVLKPDALKPGTTWLYESGEVLIGRAYSPASEGREYMRHLDAEEIQYQLGGTRTLVTQRGALELSPGDFVRIPKGVAFTSIHAGPSAHIALASVRPVPQVAEGGQPGVRLGAADLERLRSRLRSR